jgi:hypothetical protein
VPEEPGDDIEQALTEAAWGANGVEPALVVAVVHRLQRVRSEEEGRQAYNDVLDTIGHNHSGWLHDAAGSAAGVLAAIARNSDGWARWTALEVLIDCLAWVRPEQRFVRPDGSNDTVRNALRDAVASLAAELHAMATRPDTMAPIRTSAAELLAALDEIDAT